MDDDIKKWIKQAKGAGMTDEKISQKLLADGWDKDKISELLNPGYNRLSNQLKITTNLSRSYRFRVLPIILLIVGLFLASIAESTQGFGGVIIGYLFGWGLSFIGFILLVKQFNINAKRRKILAIIGAMFWLFIISMLFTDFIEIFISADEKITYINIAFGIMGIILIFPFIQNYSKDRGKDEVSELLHPQGNQSMEEQSQQQPTLQTEKPFYKRWWFYAILLILLILIPWVLQAIAFLIFILTKNTSQ